MKKCVWIEWCCMTGYLLAEHLAGGTLHFSDGSQLSVTAIPNDGSPKSISFPKKR